MASEDQEGEARMVDSAPQRPKLHFGTITFSDGNTLTLDEDDIVVFVGPNNAGKSAALRELEAWIARSMPGLVVKDATLDKQGTAEDLRLYLEANAQKSGDVRNLYYGGIGYNIHHSHVSSFDHETDQHLVAPFFARQLATEGRITDSNAAPGIALFQDPPTHPIHLLLMDPVLAKDMSEKFKHAFGKDLTPFRAGGGKFPLYVGDKPIMPPGTDELTKEFVDALLASNVLLEPKATACAVSLP